MRIQCTRCRKKKGVYAFGKDPNKKNGRKSWCKKCYSAYNAQKLKEYRHNNPKYERQGNLKKNYGITLSEYDALLKKQNYCCAICGRNKKEFVRELDVDHCHKTGKIRGLLCIRCNTMIGLAKEDADVLCKAITYLDKMESVI